MQGMGAGYQHPMALFGSGMTGMGGMSGIGSVPQIGWNGQPVQSESEKELWRLTERKRIKQELKLEMKEATTKMIGQYENKLDELSKQLQQCKDKLAAQEEPPKKRVKIEKEPVVNFITGDGQVHEFSLPLNKLLFYNKFGKESVVRGPTGVRYELGSVRKGQTLYVNTLPPQLLEFVEPPKPIQQQQQLGMCFSNMLLLSL